MTREFLSAINLWATGITILLAILISSDLASPDILLFIIAFAAMPHFAITLFLYDNKRLTSSFPRHYLISYFFLIPALIFIFIACVRVFSEWLPLYVVLTLVLLIRAFDSYHVQRQYFGVSLLLDPPSDPTNISNRNKFHLGFAGLWFLNVMIFFTSGAQSPLLFVLAFIIFLCYAYQRVRESKTGATTGKLNILVIGVAFMLPFYDLRFYVLAILSHYAEYIYLFSARFLTLGRLSCTSGVLKILIIGFIGVVAFYSLVSTGGIFAKNWDLREFVTFFLFADGLFILHYYLDSLIWKSRSRYYGDELRNFYGKRSVPQQ